MSSALTGNKIKDSYQSLLKIGTNGSLDPTTAIAVSDGLGNDTPLLLSGIEFKTQVVSANKNYGLWLDLSSNSHTAIGDYNLQYNYTQLYLSDFNNIIQTAGGGNANARGLSLNFASSLFEFGDFNAVNNGNSFWIDDANNLMRTYSGGQRNGLQFDFGAKTYSFGDFEVINNGTHINIDDDTETITVNANVNLALVGAGLENTGAGSSSGKYLRILLNGNEYKIDLLDP
jgi:hypothetical protein